MRKRELDKTLSAVVLVVYGLIWLINFIFSQTTFVQSQGFLTTMHIIKAIMQVFVYIVLFYNAWQISGGMIYRILIILVTLWLIFCVIAGFIPGLNIQTICL